MDTASNLAPNNYSELRVLVVDDHHFLRTAVQRMLNALGVQDVLQANDGHRALDILQGEPPEVIDVVLCDLDMPGMDGMEFLRHLAYSHPQPLSIIIMSGLEAAIINSVEKMARAYGLRLLGAVEKPISQVKLAEMLTRHFQPTDDHPVCDLHPCTLDEILAGVENKQFEPFFQPKLDLRNHHVVGAEALARWRHPRHGLLEPRDFIHVLESSEQMDTLTFFMLQETAMASHLLHELGHNIVLSVNLSLTTLNDPTLAERITETIHSAGVEPRNIILEITESVTRTDSAAALENLARLRMRGFGLSIDDYGTGASSMQQLTRMAFTELKIDATFIQGMSGNHAQRVLVESCIDMAHKLQAKCVGEGVENEGDWQLLQELGCDYAQGYHLARPMDLTALLEFCATH